MPPNGSSRNTSPPGRIAFLLLLVALSTASLVSAEKVVTLFETEVLQDQWRAVSPSRWTTENGVAAAPPNQLNPPSTALRWLGDWKIVTGENRDSLGWEYQTSKDGLPLRRRVWLRTVEPVHIPSPPQQQPSRKGITQRKRRRTDSSPLKSNPVTKRVRENWNFKGFGLSFYKSLIFTDSFGLAVRLPITYNFDWWERHPSLPSITTSACIYRPFMVVWFINASVDTTTITYVLEQTLRTSRYVVLVTILFVLRALIFPLVVVQSIVNGPVKGDHRQGRRLPLLEDWLDRLRLSTVVTPWPYAPPVYNLDWQERVGISWSWRWSTRRGRETRLSKWYLFLPTVVSLWDAMIKPVMVRILGPEKRVSSKATLIEWLRQKTTSIGLSTGVPTPDPPHFSCSGLLTLSGLYFRRRIGIRSQPVSSFNSEDVDLNDGLSSDLTDDGLEFVADAETSSTEKPPQQSPTRTTTKVDSVNRLLSG